jgi:hypothetical protein
MAQRPPIPERNTSVKRKQNEREELTFEAEERGISYEIGKAQKRLKPQGSFSAEFAAPLDKMSSILIIL